jgi:signal transduction histidine kinase
LSHTLTNDSIVENTLFSLLAAECKKVNAVKKCVFTSQLQQAELHLPYQCKSVLLRIAQEFIQNSIKHANCETITVALSNNQNELKLLLDDDGIGMDLQQSKSNWGIGLQNIQKRTEIIGGKMELSSQNNGTCLTIKIPMSN